MTECHKWRNWGRWRVWDGMGICVVWVVWVQYHHCGRSSIYLLCPSYELQRLPYLSHSLIGATDTYVTGMR